MLLLLLMRPRRLLLSFFYFNLWQQLMITLVNKFPENFKAIESDANRSIPEIVRSRGFECESHFVTTDDGYILQMIRIVNPVRRSLTKKPILLFHGFQCTGSLWLLASDGILMRNGEYRERDVENITRHLPANQSLNALGFALAARDYDVWLANYRGSPYSTNHTKLKTDSPEFWSFSIDEMISFDLPALIDYIQEKTETKHISYVGHSQGSFMMLGLLSQKPWFSQRVKPIILLSPVFFLNQWSTPIRYLAPLKDVLRSNPSIVPYGEDTIKAYSTLCQSDYFKKICFTFFQHFFGGHESNINMQRLSTFLANVPLGSSSWNAAHFFQMLEHGNPVHFDFGPEKNMIKYGSFKPPLYNVSAINSTNLSLFYVSNDFFNALINVNLLKQALRVPLMNEYLIGDDSWSHMDLVWAKNVGELVNSKILDINSRYD